MVLHVGLFRSSAMVLIGSTAVTDMFGTPGKYIADKYIYVEK